MSMNLVIITAVFVVVMAVALVVGLRISQAEEKRRRLVSVITSNKAASTSAGDSKDKQLAKQRADIARKLKEAGKDEKKKDGNTIKKMMVEAGFEAPPSKYWMFSTIFAVVAFALMNVATDWPQIAVVMATFTAFLGVPRMFLRWRAGKRQKNFLEEFPDALDAAVRLLQAGMPITEAIAMASREFTGVLKEEMTRMYENQKIGTPLGQAALETARRIPLTEVHMFATALQIQSETGSSLSEVLSNLSAVIRARFRLKRKVKSLSSEAKASAAIIGSLPILVTFGLHMANPEYIALLYTTTKGKFLASIAAGWMTTGILVMRQMINFKI